MQPGEDPFQFKMETDQLEADLHRLGGRFITQLIKCVIIVTGLSADYEIEVRVLQNNPTGLERSEIERVVGNQTFQAAAGLKGFIGIERHHLGRPRREEQEISQPIQG